MGMSFIFSIVDGSLSIWALFIQRVPLLSLLTVRALSVAQLALLAPSGASIGWLSRSASLLFLSIQRSERMLLR